MGTKWRAALIGAGTTLLLFASAFALDAAGFERTARFMFWQNEMLQGLIPPLNIGTAQHPVYEGSPLNILAFFASVPLGFVIYSVAAYWALRIWRRGT